MGSQKKSIFLLVKQEFNLLEGFPTSLFQHLNMEIKLDNFETQKLLHSLINYHDYQTQSSFLWLTQKRVAHSFQKFNV